MPYIEILANRGTFYVARNPLTVGSHEWPISAIRCRAIGSPPNPKSPEPSIPFVAPLRPIAAKLIPAPRCASPPAPYRPARPRPCSARSTIRSALPPRPARHTDASSPRPTTVVRTPAVPPRSTRRNHAAAFPTDFAALEIHDAHGKIVVAATVAAAGTHSHAVPPPSACHAGHQPRPRRPVSLLLILHISTQINTTHLQSPRTSQRRLHCLPPQPWRLAQLLGGRPWLHRGLCASASPPPTASGLPPSYIRCRTPLLLHAHSTSTSCGQESSSRRGSSAPQPHVLPQERSTPSDSSFRVTDARRTGALKQILHQDTFTCSFLT
ncbi:hypothetical protein BS78_01G339700 [Paspalum vaginatum]|nr:hypothetical protein BS78_01G339700 [Paspalum vaginatum]KAJ1296938.1 hypothetical protein BS78_01G339700 [Paspalum vaginatum]KAJ1296939.1 hypothetical protein BS78_01G339700 [Paspalum vaginatum]